MARSNMRVNSRDCQQEQQVGFFDSVPGWTTTVPSAPDGTFSISGSDMASLSEFFARPIKVSTFAVDIGSTFSASFNPWSNYFTNAAVQRKLENFSFLRCKLYCKIVINATPFMYSALYVSYLPHQSEAAYADGVMTSEDAHLCRMSQRPSLILDVSKNQSGCLCLPFVHYRNWLDVGKLNDFTNFGRIDLRLAEILQSANGATNGQLNISVYTWASDVQLCVPTTQLAMQGEIEEAASGPISGPASSVAAIAGRLSDVPVLGPYAKATQIAAGGIAAIARLFGLSRVVQTSAPQFMKASGFANLASTETTDTAYSLALTSKQELCVDPRTVGLDNTDELTISSIATREAYFGQFLWNENQTSGTILFSGYCNPFYRVKQVISTLNHLLPLPAYFAAYPFQFWRGDIVFHLRIVCTPYHRGRLMLVWDPRGLPSTSVDVTNIANVEIIDISTTRDFEVTIPYSHLQPFLPSIPVDSPDFEAWAAGTIVYSGSSNNFGIFQIRVLNDLTSPADAAPVTVLMSMRMGDNFAVAAPRALTPTYEAGYTITNQGDVENEVEFTTQEAETTAEILDVKDPVDDLYHVYFGEQVLSFRALLKRYALSCDFNEEINAQAGWAWLVVRRWLSYFPAPCGDVSDAIGSGAPGFNRVELTVYQWLQHAFLFRRGSHRWKHQIEGPLGEAYVGLMNYDTQNADGSTYLLKGFDATLYPNRSPYTQNTSTIATSTFDTAHGQMVEVDLPWYSPRRAAFCAIENNMSGAESSAGGYLNYSVLFRANAPTNNTKERFSVRSYFAVGNDFNFFFFLNTPEIAQIPG